MNTCLIILLLFLHYRVLFLSPKDENGVRKRLVYQGGWLLTCPEEDFNRMGMMVQGDATTYSQALLNESQPMLDQTGIQVGVANFN